MPVNQTCTTDALALELDLRVHRLRYRVTTSDELSWQLLDEQRRPLLATGAIQECLWPPVPAAFPAADDVTHALGVQFGQGGTLEWTVELVTGAGDLVSVVKQCRYDHTGTSRAWFDSLRILITGRPA